MHTTRTIAASLVLTALALSATAVAQADSAPARVEADGTVHMPAFDLPVSVFMSDEARRAFIKMHREPLPIDASSPEKFRETTQRYYWQPLLQRARARYAVEIADERIAGVPVAIVTPKEGVATGKQDRVLINVHGGSFMIGAGIGGLVESIPIAAATGTRIITINYRLTPEHRFPAASEDVLAVYKELLKKYSATNIGMYGCSAGGILTTQTVARLLKEHLPLPAAIGLFCAGGDPRYAGDSRYFTPPLDGSGAPPPSTPNPPSLLFGYSSYLSQADLDNPLAAPALSVETLARFPPTLLVTGTRGYELSSVVYVHSQLIKAGVDADLHVWDGLWHGFHYDVELPESREVFAITAKFFDKHLGLK
jgi:acetyl esterase/lipase